MFNWLNKIFFRKTGKNEELNVLSLRPKVWKIEFDPNKVRDYLHFHHKPIFAGIIVLAVILLSTSWFRTKASVANFYTETCLGGWENTSGAQGKPDVEDFENLDLFTKENSAIMNNSNAEIFCGNFQGEIPENSAINKINVKFSWAFKDRVTEDGINQFQDINLGETVIEEIAEENIVSEEVETGETKIEKKKEEIVPVPVKETQKQEVLEAPKEEVSLGFLSRVSSSIKNKIKPKALAQEEVQVIEIKQEELVEPKEEPKIEIPKEEAFPVVEKEVTPKEEAKTETPKEEVLEITEEKPEEILIKEDVFAEEVSHDEFLEIKYTLDGESWKTLSYVSSQNWQDASFEIVDDELRNWQDVSKIQISIQSLPSLDSQPVVFLDSIFLEIEYEDIVVFEIDESLPQVVLAEDFVGSEKSSYKLDENPTFTLEYFDISESEVEELIQDGEANIKEDANQKKALNIEDIFKKDTSRIEENSFLRGVLDVFPSKKEEEKRDLDSKKEIKKDKEKVPVEVLESKNEENVEVIEAKDESLDKSVSVFKNRSKNKKVSFKTRVAQAGPSIQSLKKEIKVELESKRGEKTNPQFNLDYVENENGEEVLQVSIIKNEKSFSPGVYTMRVYSLKDNFYLLHEKKFSWGVLVVNIDRSVAIPNTQTYLQMATLNNYGHTLCDANLRLTITKPSGATEIFETDGDGPGDGNTYIARASTCGVDNYVETPDYFLYYTPVSVGAYKLKLENLDRNEEIESNFKVGNNESFDVVRSSTSRTNPFLQQNYFMNFTIKASQAFSGQIIETVPAGFIVVPKPEYKTKTNIKGETEIIWTKELAIGEAINLSYEYDPPDISPKLFLHGPLKFYAISTKKTLVWKESRQWQIASDATCTSAGAGNWTTISWTGCASGPQNGDIVVIDHNVTLNTNSASLERITINTGVTLNTDGSSRILTLEGTSGVLFTRVGTWTQGNSEVRIVSASGSPTLLSAITTFHKLTINSTANVVNMGAFAVTINNVSGAAFNIQAGVFNVGGAAFTGPGASNGTFTIASGATFCLGGTTDSTNATCDSGATDLTARAMPTFQTYAFNTSSNVFYLANAAVTVAAIPSPGYGNLTFRPVMTAARTFTLSAGQTISGNFLSTPTSSITANRILTVNLGTGVNTFSGTFVLSGRTTAFTGSTTFAVAANSGTFSSGVEMQSVGVASILSCSTGTITTPSMVIAGTFTATGLCTINLTGTSGTLITRTGTFTQSTSEVIVKSASGTPTLLSATVSFSKLTIDTGGTEISAGAVINIPTNAANKLHIKTGSLNDGGFAMTGGALSFLEINSGATLKLGSSGSGTAFPTNFVKANIIMNSGSTVIYRAGVNQTVSSVPDYANLRIEPVSGTPIHSLALAAATTINGDLYIGTNGTFTNASGVITGPGSGSGTFTIVSGARFCLTTTALTCSTSNNVPTTMPVFQTYAFNVDSEVIYMGNIDMSISPAPAYGKLSFRPSALGATRTYTFDSGNVVINSDFTVNPTGTTGNRTLTVNLGGATTVGGTFFIDPSGASTRALLDTISGFDYAFTVRDLNIGASVLGATLNIRNSTLTITGTTGTLFTRSGAFLADTSSTVIFNGSASVTLTSGDFTGSNAFNNLTFNPTIAGTRAYTFGSGAIEINGDFNINPNGAFGNRSFTVNMGNSITVTGTTTLGGSTYAYSTLNTVNGSNYALTTGKLDIQKQTGALENDSTLIANNSTITLTGTSGTLLTKTGALDAGGSTIIMNPNENLTLTSGVFTGSSAIYNLTLNPSLSSSAKTYTFGAGAIEINGDFTINPSGNQLLTVTLGSGGLTVANGKTLTITKTGGGVTSALDTGGYSLTTGILSIESSATLTANGSAISIRGNYTNNGTFTAGTSTVTISGTSQQTLSGTTTGASGQFYNLTFTNNSGSDPDTSPSIILAGSLTATNNFTITTANVKVRYNAGSTYTFNNINWNGQAVGTRVMFRSSTASAWLLVVSGTQTVQNVNAKDSDASGGITINATHASNFDATGNTNWNFTVAGTLISGTAYDDSALSLWTGAGQCDGATANIALSINGGTKQNVSCDASTGVWTFVGLTWVTGDTLTVFMDTNAGGGGTGVVYTITADTTTNIIGISLIKNQIRTRSESASVMTNQRINSYDADQDADIPVTVTLSGTYNLVGGVEAELFVVSGSTYQPGGNTTVDKLNIAGTYTAGSETITIQGVFSTLLTRTGVFNAGTSTVVMNPFSNVTVTSGSFTGSNAFYNLTFSPDLAAARIYTFGSDITINGDFNIAPTASSGNRALTVRLGGATIVTGTTTLGAGNNSLSNLDTISGSDFAFTTGRLIIQKQTSGPTLDSTFTANNSTVTLTGTSGTLITKTGAIEAGGSTFIMNPNANVTLTSGDFTGSSAFYNLILSPSLSASDKIYTFGAGTIETVGDLTIGPSGNQLLTVNLGAGGLVVASDKTATVTRTSTATANLNTTASDYSLTTGNMVMLAGGTLTANGSTVTVAKDFYNTGTFTAGTSTVVLSTLNDSYFTGATTFNNLSIVPNDAKNVYFSTSGTHIITINGLFTVTGSALGPSGSLVKLYSHTSGTPDPGVKWHIDHQGTESIDYADVKDGGCESGSTTIDHTNTTDSGNNEFCWNFAPPSISFSLGANSVNLGTLSPFSTGTAFHTFNASTGSNGGFSIYLNGTTLTSVLSKIISAISVEDFSNQGTEQFGVNVRANTTPSVGADVVTNSGTCGYGVGFATADKFSFDVSGNNSLTNVTTASDCDYTVSYIANIDTVTDSGNYSTTLTYTIIGTF